MSYKTTYVSKSVRAISPDSFGAGWLGMPYGDLQHFEIKHSPEYVVMTGSAVNSELFVPYPHRIIQVLAEHITAVDIKDTTALTTGLFQRREWHAGDVAASQWFSLYNFGATVYSDFIQFAGEAWEFPEGYYRFSVNTTNLHLMLYKIRLQFLDKKGKELGQGTWNK